MSFSSSVSHSACISLYKLPVTDTLYKKFFEFSQINLLEKGSFASRVQAWTSSLNKTSLLNRLVTANRFDKDSSEMSALHKLYNELGDSMTIQSSYDYFRYLMTMSILHRFLELTFLSLINKIDRQNWRINTKYWVKAVTELAPYILMYSLGYPPLELLTYKLFTVLISKHMPYEVSSFVRNMDLISSDKGLKFIDFIKRNFLVMLRNLFVTYVLFELMLWKIFSLQHEDIFFKRDWAEIELCEKNSSNTYYMVLYSNASAKNLRYITDELGWILGKMLFDLVWAFTLQKGLKVKDLRDPWRVHN